MVACLIALLLRSYSSPHTALHQPIILSHDKHDIARCAAHYVHGQRILVAVQAPDDFISGLGRTGQVFQLAGIATMATF